MIFFTVCPTGLESSTVRPGATAISQFPNNSDFSESLFLSQCCCISTSVSLPLTTGNIVCTSAETKAGFLAKKPSCCLLKGSNASNEFSCTVALCEDGVGVSEQHTDGNRFAFRKS